MQQYVVPVLIVLSICLSSSTFCKEIPIAIPEDVGMSSERLQRVDEIIDGFIRNKQLAGSIVMIARHGKIVHNKAYGLMDIEKNKLMREDAIMAIASMTKAITSVAALMLYEDGVLELDAPVSLYLPQLKNLKVMRNGDLVVPTREMTIQDLMRHTSGWGAGQSGDAQLDKLYKDTYAMMSPNDSFEQRVDLISKLPLEFEPGTDWIYSISSDVLGLVVEAVSNQPLDEFFRKRIFEPLDMPDTACYIADEKSNRVATVYQSDGKGSLKVMAMDTFKNRPVLCSGSWGLVSTARDYMRFLMIANDGSLHGTRLLTKTSVDMMRHNQLPEEVRWVNESDQDTPKGVQKGLGFGLGFSVTEELSEVYPASQLGEYGWDGVFSTHYWLSPKDDIIVVTFQQILPFSRLVIHGLKGPIYDTVLRK